MPEIEPDALPRAIQRLAEQFWLLADAAPDEEKRRKARFMAENTSRMHQNFARVWNAVQL